MVRALPIRHLVAAAFRLRSTSRFPGTAFGFDVPIAIPLKKDGSAASCPRPSSSIRPALRPQILPPAYSSSAPPRPAHRLRLHAPIFLGRGCPSSRGIFRSTCPGRLPACPLQPRTLHCLRVPMPADPLPRAIRVVTFSAVPRSHQILHMSIDMFFFCTSVNTPFLAPPPKNPPNHHPFLRSFSQCALMARRGPIFALPSA